MNATCSHTPVYSSVKTAATIALVRPLTTRARCPAPVAKTMSQPGVRVLVVDDHPVVRQGLAACLARHNVQVVGEAANGREAIRRVKELAPDIVLMDLDMPHMSGLAAAELLRRENPGVKVIVLSMYTHSEYVLRILQSGARGYVLKDAPVDQMLKAIEAVQGGGTFFSPDVASLALNQFVRGTNEDPNCKQVSNREREVLIAIAEGLSNKEIACRLNVGVRTVETHRERIMRKLNIHSVAGLTKYAIQKGLILMPRGPEAAFSQ